MIRAIILGALALALLVVLPRVAPAAGLHPRCNIDFPCEIRAQKTTRSQSLAMELPKAGTNYARNYARHTRRADRFRNVEFGSPMYPPETQRAFLGKSSGLVAPLAAKLASIQSACPGTVAISGFRHTYVAGTRRISLHASGKAVDVRGPYGCIYAQLRGWQGGYSTDAGRVRHIHISYDADGGREMGLAFRHGGRKHARHRTGHRLAAR